MNLDAADRHLLGVIGVWLGVMVVSVPGAGLLLGLAVRVFRMAAGWN